MDKPIRFYKQKIGDDSGVWGVEFGTSIPLWFWSEQTGNIKESGFELQIAQNDEIYTRKSLENDINHSFIEYENSLRQIRFFRDEAIKEVEEIFRQ